MIRKVLVTGGAGFIGRKLVTALIQSGFRVTVLDNLSRGNPDLIPELIRNRIQWFVGDTRDASLVFRLVEDSEAVIHLAAGSSFYLYEVNPLEETLATIEGFLNIIEAMKQFGIKKVVYASTSAVYEGNDVPFREGMKLSPPDLKSLSKKANEDMAHLYSRRYGLKAIGLRPANVYGDEEVSKGKFANTVSLFVWAMLTGKPPVLWGDGEQTRDFIYVDDVVQAFLLALERDLDTQEFNVGTGVETSMNQLVSLINCKLQTDLEPLYRAVPIPVYADRIWVDTTYSEKILGFKAHVSLNKGLDHVITGAKRFLDSMPELSHQQWAMLEDS